MQDVKRLSEILQTVPLELRAPLEQFAETLYAEIRREISAYLEDGATLRRIERRLALSEERAEERFARLGDALSRLAEAQARTEERVSRLEETVQRLAEAQARTEERVSRLEEAIQRLAEAQARTEEEFRKYREASEARFERIEAALNRLAEAQARTEERVSRLEETVQRVEESLLRLQEMAQEQIRALRYTVEAIRDWQRSAEEKLGVLDGFYLEYDYERKAPAILGEALRKVRVVPRDRLEDFVQSLSWDEWRDLIRADFIARGRVLNVPGEPEVWAAVEVSSVVDEKDVTRAARRAALLRKAGYTAIPIVAGRRLTKEASDAAALENVVVITDGASSFWREALTAAGVELPPDWKSSG